MRPQRVAEPNDGICFAIRGSPEQRITLHDKNGGQFVVHEIQVIRYWVNIDRSDHETSISGSSDIGSKSTGHFTKHRDPGHQILSQNRSVRPWNIEIQAIKYWVLVQRITIHYKNVDQFVVFTRVVIYHIHVYMLIQMVGASRKHPSCT